MTAMTLTATTEQLNELADVRPIAQRLHAVFGSRNLARLLDVDPSNLENAVAGRRPFPGQLATKLIDLEFLLSRVAQVFVGQGIIDWLLSADVHRAGARRIDIFASAGVAPLLEDLDRLTQGGYA
jgi:hypothetical protein